MPISIRGFISGIGRNLTRLDDQPLGKAALAIIVLLDAFILYSIFDGLRQHTSQLTRPDEYVPPACQALLLDDNPASNEWLNRA